MRANLTELSTANAPPVTIASLFLYKEITFDAVISHVCRSVSILHYRDCHPLFFRRYPLASSQQT